MPKNRLTLPHFTSKRLFEGHFCKCSSQTTFNIGIISLSNQHKICIFKGFYRFFLLLLTFFLAFGALLAQESGSKTVIDATGIDTTGVNLPLWGITFEAPPETEVISNAEAVLALRSKSSPYITWNVIALPGPYSESISDSEHQENLRNDYAAFGLHFAKNATTCFRRKVSNLPAITCSLTLENASISQQIEVTTIFGSEFHLVMTLLADKKVESEKVLAFRKSIESRLILSPQMAENAAEVSVSDFRDLPQMLLIWILGLGFLYFSVSRIAKSIKKNA